MWLRACVVLAVFLAAGCTTSSGVRSEDRSFFECPNGGGYRCSGSYDASVVETLTPPLPDCEALLAEGLKRPKTLRVEVLDQGEFFLGKRTHAALLDALDMDVQLPESAGRKAGRLFVRVPRGFVTDFNSVPLGLPQAVHRSFGRNIYPAVMHDFLYAVGDQPCATSGAGWPATPVQCQQPSMRSQLEERRQAHRRLADQAFREAAKTIYPERWSPAVLYLAVRVGGNSGFGRPEGLKFLALSQPDSVTIVVPSQEFDAAAGYPRSLKDAYVRFCPT